VESPGDYRYKGKGVLLHLLADKNGRPILIKNRGAKGNEKEEALELLKRIQEYRSLEQGCC